MISSMSLSFRKMPKTLVVALVSVLWLNACVSKMEKPVAAVSGILAEEAVFQKYKNEGDREFNKMFWQGWQNAIDCYERALEIKNEPGLTGRLFDAYLLIAFRELYLQIPLSNRQEKLADLLMQIPGSEYGVFVRIIGSLAQRGKRESPGILPAGSGVFLAGESRI
jgi:hypothetical protein